jgi:ferritin-like metal-binding protein YciE
MKIDSLDKLLEDQLKDIYSAETQLVKALPKLAKACSSDTLKECFTTHLEETQGQVERLTKIAEMLEVKLTGKKCAAMEGLIEEAKEVLDADGPEDVIDAALIIAAQKVEHYEISAYGSARTLAEHLGHEEVVNLLQETLEEEEAADEKLTNISIEEILAQAESMDEDEEMDEEEERSPRGA